MKFVCWGDAHLWPITWKRFSQLRGDSEVAARYVTEYASEKGLPILFAGDIFDHGESGAVARELSLLRNMIGSTDFYYVVGNHESTGSTAGEENTPWLNVLNSYNIIHLQPDTDDYETGLSIAGLDYMPTEELIPALDSLRESLNGEKLDILVCHQAIKELFSMDGAYHVDCDQLSSIAHVVVSGHIHIPKVWEHNGTTFVSPGSTAVNNWGELVFSSGESVGANRGFYVIDYNDGKVTDVERVIIPDSYQRTFFDLEAMDAEGEADVLEAIRTYTPVEGLPPELRTALMRVRYKQASYSFAEEMRTLAADNDIVLDLVPVHDATEVNKELAPFVSDSDDLTDSYSKIVDRHIDMSDEDSELIKRTVFEILNQGKPAETIDRLVETITS